MAAFIHHFSFEFRTALRNPTQMLMNYLFPLGFYVLMGLLMVPINPQFAGVMMPAMVVFNGLASGVLGLPGPLAESREAGIYRSYKINGVPAVSILAIPTITTVFHMLIVAAIIALTASSLFAASAPTHWTAFAAISLVTAFSLSALGALIGVVAAGARSIVLFSQLIFLPSMLLAGLMLPLDLLPASLRVVSRLLPATYSMQAYLGLAYGQPTVIPATASAAILLAGGVVAFGLAIYLFNWDSRNVSRRGHPLLALLAWLPYLAGMILL